MCSSDLCSDGNVCTDGDGCKAGKCEGGTAKTCDDGNPCTTDLCDAGKGCVALNAANDCSDGNACTVGDTCKDKACVPGSNACQCQQDADCAPQDPCLFGKTICDKSVPGKFVCKGVPLPGPKCDSSKDTACAVNTCDPASGQCTLQPTAGNPIGRAHV